MTKKKNKKKAPQFPKNYRFITESKAFTTISNYWFRLLNQSKVKKFFKFTTIVLVFLTIAVLIFGITLFSLDLYKYYQDFGKVNAERLNLQSQLNFWESISNKYEGYKDAYFRMALIEYNLGDFKNAKANNKKALLLDPNFSDAKKLEEVLDRSY